MTATDSTSPDAPQASSDDSRLAAEELEKVAGGTSTPAPPSEGQDGARHADDYHEGWS